MKIMFFDTETTGLPQWKQPSDHPSQPHLCQFTAILVDGAPEREIDYADLLVKPDGWTIEPDALARHGIALERLMADGLPERDAVDTFLRMRAKADLVCAFGIDFDMRIMRIAMLRHGMTKREADDLAAATTTHCVMRQVTPLCKIPPTDKMMAVGRKTYKTPTLGEAIKALFGETLEDAHDARADVLATSRLYFHVNKAAAA